MKNTPPFKPLDTSITTGQAARMLGVCVTTVKKYIEVGTLKAYRRCTGGHYRVEYESIVRLAQQKHAQRAGDQLPPGKTNC